MYFKNKQYKNWKITHWLLLFLKMKFIMQTFFTTTHPSIFNLLKIGSKKRGRLSKTRIRLVIVSSDKPISPCQSLLHSHCRSPKGKQLLFYLPNKRHWIFFLSSLSPMRSKRSFQYPWKYIFHQFKPFCHFYPLSWVWLKARKRSNLEVLDFLTIFFGWFLDNIFFQNLADSWPNFFFTFLW